MDEYCHHVNEVYAVAVQPRRRPFIGCKIDNSEFSLPCKILYSSSNRTCPFFTDFFAFTFAAPSGQDELVLCALLLTNVFIGFAFARGVRIILHHL